MTEQNEAISEHEIIANRREKLTEWREQTTAFPTDFKRDAFAQDLLEQYGQLSPEELQALNLKISVAGRMMLRRVMGKASFAHVQDMTGRIQLYIKGDDCPEGVYEEFKKWDLGDIIGASGFLFKTKTGELSVHVNHIRLLTKSVRPLPEKFHGLTDVETRYRQRYLDLLMNADSRRVFEIRMAVIQKIRDFFLARRFMEVETPMMHPIPGGAAARPFVTHHNTLDMELYLRIAPELYLKRLVVGGFERVFEINRNFRNEGISVKHNPEFTMLEFYQAYADYRDLIALTENLMREMAESVLGTAQFEYQGHALDFSQSFTKLTVHDAILQFNPTLKPEDMEDIETLKAYAAKLGISVHPDYGRGKIWIEIFEKTVENNLIQPTFITAYPMEVSPLARMNDIDPFVTDRFEFFVGGRELANGFSELNDPEDQDARFKQQVKAKAAGDVEAMHYDADYIRALEHGLPPTAGEGIGIDRLVMLFANAASIRDVILFPQCRPE